MSVDTAARIYLSLFTVRIATFGAIPTCWLLAFAPPLRIAAVVGFVALAALNLLATILSGLLYARMDDYKSVLARFSMGVSIFYGDRAASLAGVDWNDHKARMKRAAVKTVLLAASVVVTGSMLFG